MALTVDITEGWTAPLDFTLKLDGSAANLTGYTVTAIVKDQTGATVDTTSDATVTTAATGSVRLIPDAADFTAAGSPYTIHWKVVDGSNQIAFAPSGEPDVIRVFPT